MSKHILLYTDDPGVGGVAQYNHNILSGLVALGYEVTCVQGRSDNPLVRLQKELGIQHVWLEFDTNDFGRTLINRVDAQNILTNYKPDFIIFSDCCPLSNFAAKQVAIQFGIPYIAVIGFVAPYLADRFAAYLDELSHIYIQAQAVIAVSTDNLTLLHELFRLPKDKGQVIYYGRPAQYFAPPALSVRERLRQEFNIPSNAVVCFTAARLEFVKGYQYQLEAIKQLNQRKVWHNLHFVWAGAGNLETQIKEAIEQLGVSNHVTLLGQRWDIINWLDASDIFILPSELEGMPLCIMEAMAKGLPVIASAVSGIPEELGDTGKLLTDPKVEPQATVKELVTTIQAWSINPELRHSIGQTCKTRAEEMFREERMVKETVEVIEHALLPVGDYVSPKFSRVQPDKYFPNMIVGDTSACRWSYLRREVPHNWYVDKRQPTVGFLSRDEAHIVYNTALQFRGKRALEIGCWLGWSACHLALAGVELDVVDPLLSRPEFYESVSNSLKAAGVLDSVNLIAGYSPQKVEELATQLQRKWSLIFIDGDHDTPGPLNDAIACEQLAEADALILFHDLASPDVAQGLDYLKQRGWNTIVYQTMQIMGVAWRGNVEPVRHQPDPKVDWELPEHLQFYFVSGMSSSQSVNETVTLQQVQEMMQQALDLLNNGEPVEAMRTAEKAASLRVNVPGMHYIKSVCLCAVGRHKEALEAAKAELAINPAHPQALAQVEGLTRGLSKPEIKIPTQQRTWNTTLPRETMLSIQLASHNYSYRGVPMIKNPFDFALYPLLIWNLKPRTIIEIGSKNGGSALWLGDMLKNFGISGHIYSVDIVKVNSVQHPCVTFMEGNGRALKDTFTHNFLNSLPRPMLVIEDADHAYETSKHVLEFFHPYIKNGEYVVIEDGIISDLAQDASYNSGPHQALKEFLSAHEGEYEIDGSYCDFFGYNLTWCTNGFLKKLRTVSVGEGQLLDQTSEIATRPMAAKEAVKAEAANLRHVAEQEVVRLCTSELNDLIPPEIKNDEFFYAVQKLAREEDIKTILEIGSSAGEGSTEAFVTGIRKNPNKPTLFCMEISKSRFAQLQKRYANDSFVSCYNFSSVSLEQFPNENEVVAFYNTYRTGLNHYPLDRVLGWLRQDIENVKNFGVTDNGIKRITQENKVNFFDVVLIDGSEFTGTAELEEVYGARFILLDDINTFKNYKNYRRLLADPDYVLVTQNPSLRNGYAIFKRVNNEVICQSPALPIHFFTIVLNGEPFIRYHIDVFKQLPFQWHWHIIEGVADLKHDTAWSLRNGGRVTDEVHRNGRSNDGTTEYLDELARLYPENVTVYRKPEGVFWDGKREMVNAPLANINEECLLWQVDVDELWTVEQILTARKMFINNPDKTAAFYWCWYFVGENLVISTRNCYAQNPQQEWLRTWRFKPGAVWAAHEPPRLAEPLPNGEWRDVATVNPFLHEETDQLGLIFQHFAYVTPQQLRFKEQYYGYTNAVSGWMELQAQTQFPVLLRQYFPWVQDGTQVDTANSCSLVPIAQREARGEVWRFLQVEELQRQPVKIEKSSPTIIVDGVFFQLYKTGIARVWHSLLEEWADNGFAKHIVVLDRAGTAPKIPGIRYRLVPPYDYGKTDADREMLQQVCDEEGADLFISSYYTTPLSTPSVFMAHDMIPELMGWDLNHPMWREKHYGIQHATTYIAVSENTARDLVKVFPDIALESVTVAKNGVSHKIFSPAIPEKISRFKTKYGISKPYFILVGSGSYKNTILFFKAFAQLFSKHGFEIVCTGSGWLLETELRNYTSGSVVHMLQLSDEELSIAYSGAVALVYPSKYEGFGLPVLEAIACGCPVITCPNASIPEVAGEAALYVNDDDVEWLTNALCDVQKPNIRNSLIAAGLEQAKKFSWSKMAKTVSSALIDATLLPLNLKDINLIVFPDWCQPEESLCFELEQVIKALATHPDSSQITLLVDNGKIPDDEATLILSSVSMNLLLQEDLDVSEGPEISLVGQLSEMQWEALLPRIHARIVLENENQGAIAQLKAETIPFCELVSFSNEQAAHLKPGIWDITGHSEIIYFNRGMALRKQGKIAEAVSSYQKALEIKPDFAEASYQLSLARYENQIISKGYQFTQDWFSFNIPILEQHLKRFINITTLNVIEIGSWEGRSTCWLIDNVLTHESNRITCIDTFEGSIEHVQLYKFGNRYIQSIEGRFDFNIVRTGVPEKVQKIVGKSNEVMRALPLNCYDIAYIDGSHIASDVLEDAVLVWQLVKVGGFIIFDDYFFTFPQNPAWNTKIGIDAFMMSFKDKFRVIHKAEQVILEKTCL